MPGRRLGGQQLLRGAGERGVGEDSAARRLDAADARFAADNVLHRFQRNDRMRRTVHRNHAELVARHEEFQHLHRRQVGHIHLGESADRGGHAAGAGERDHVGG